VKIGYARVSTTDQHPESQEERLKAAGCTTVYTDKASGAKASRPQWDKCRKGLQWGDVLVAVKLDRFGRSVSNLDAIARDMKERGIGLQCLDQPIDTTTAAGKLFYDMLSAFAEFERAILIERTRDGMEHERAAGKIMGGKVPFGYKLVQGEKLRDEQALAVVKEVFERSARGESTATIAQFMTRAGYKRRDNTVGDILRNPAYVADGVVSAALATRAVEALQARRTGEVRRTSAEDYSGMLWCRCGSVMWRKLAGAMPGKGVEPTRYYRCSGHPGKPVPMVRADDADYLVEQVMAGDWFPWLIPVRSGGDTRDAEKAKLLATLPKAKSRAETDAIWDAVEAVELREPEPETVEWVDSGVSRGQHWEECTIAERRAWLGAEEVRIFAWNTKQRAGGITEEQEDGSLAWSRGKVRLTVERPATWDG
jgi:DNA invertase Pin-like site-specific DNA recombinase